MNDDIKVSLVLLTWNRLDVAARTVKHNEEVAGYPIHEIVHVDNGSVDNVDSFTRDVQPAVQVRHAKNLGVSKGYNRGLLLATGTHVVITGCDRLMPEGWLARWVDAFRRVPETGVISLYSHPTKASMAGILHERYRAPEEERDGLKIRRAMPCEARMHSREFLLAAGLFREDLGLYGYEDVEWIDRAERVARDQGRINYILPDMPLAVHINEDDEHFMPGVGRYGAFKEKQNGTAHQKEVVAWAHKRGNPYYNPYARAEQSVREWQVVDFPGDEGAALLQAAASHYMALDDMITRHGDSYEIACARVRLVDAARAYERVVARLQTMREMDMQQEVPK